jgi:hypothetical protein
MDLVEFHSVAHPELRQLGGLCLTGRRQRGILLLKGRSLTVSYKSQCTHGGMIRQYISD